MAERESFWDLWFLPETDSPVHMSCQAAHGVAYRPTAKEVLSTAAERTCRPGFQPRNWPMRPDSRRTARTTPAMTPPPTPTPARPGPIKVAYGLIAPARTTAATVSATGRASRSPSSSSHRCSTSADEIRSGCAIHAAPHTCLIQYPRPIRCGIWCSGSAPYRAVSG